MSTRNNVRTLSLSFDDGETIETTGEHPFYVAGEGFTPAGRLSIGNAIVTRAGPATRLVKAVWNAAPKTVYNFTVEGDHTYFVGKNSGGLWVHNIPCSRITTVIGRNADVDAWMIKAYQKQREVFNIYRVDPSLYKLSENMQWLRDAVKRGDKIVLATDPALLSRTHVPGVANGYYTFLELAELARKKLKPIKGY